MNNPVSFEIAKLLKEKGFDEYCSFIWNEENLEKPYYYGENYEMVCLRIHYYEDIPMINNSYIKKYATYVEKDEITEEVYELLAAPTIAEVVMWLYEKHGIWIFIYPLNKVKEDFAYNICINDVHVDSNNNNRSTTQTEAYEAAIEYTLKNLIK